MNGENAADAYFDLAFLSHKCDRKLATFLCFGRKLYVVRLFTESNRRLLESERKEVNS
jgi:hypothetical protein